MAEVTITAGMTMTLWRNTLNGKLIETGWQNTWHALKYTCLQGSFIIPYISILAVMGACSSGVKVPSIKSCYGNRMVKHKENLR